MKIAYLIVAHNNPLTLGRLINRLNSENATFYVHIDKKSDIENFQSLQRDNVIFCRHRLAVYWADFTQVEASLGLIDFALHSKPDLDYLVLLSGVDYPIQTTKYIEQYFLENAGAEFINMVKMPSVADSKPLSRLTNYTLRNSDGWFYNLAQKLKMACGLLPRERDYLPVFKQMQPYAGSNWWAITASAGAYVSDFVKNNKEFVDFYKNTVCPDESFFQTIIANSHYKEKVRANLTYADWSAGGANPANISEQHLSLFSSTSGFLNKRIAQQDAEFLFARKFSDSATSVLDQLDRILDTKI